MPRCKAHEVLRNEVRLWRIAVTKDECNAADGRYWTASKKWVRADGREEGKWGYVEPPTRS